MPTKGLLARQKIINSTWEGRYSCHKYYSWKLLTFPHHLKEGKREKRKNISRKPSPEDISKGSNSIWKPHACGSLTGPLAYWRLLLAKLISLVNQNQQPGIPPSLQGPVKHCTAAATFFLWSLLCQSLWHFHDTSRSLTLRLKQHWVATTQQKVVGENTKGKQQVRAVYMDLSSGFCSPEKSRHSYKVNYSASRKNLIVRLGL